MVLSSLVELVLCGLVRSLGAFFALVRLLLLESQLFELVFKCFDLLFQEGFLLSRILFVLLCLFASELGTFDLLELNL